VHLDESNAGDLLRTLPGEPPLPPSIDIGRAMHAGRRRRRLRRAALTGGAVVLTVLAVTAVPVALRATSHKTDTTAESSSAPPSPAPASAPTSKEPTQKPTQELPAVAVPKSCTAEKLPVPDNVAQALVTAADPTGRFLYGRSYPTSGQHQLLLWTDGKATKIDIPGDDPTINAANTAGYAVATSLTDDHWAGYVYHGGTATKLPGGDAWANGINAGNTVVGVKVDPVSGLRQPAVWRTPASQPDLLALPADATNGEARAIDDDGTVVGFVYDNTKPDGRAYAWAPDGTGRALPSPDKSITDAYVAYTVRNGWATGIVGLRTTSVAGVRWNLHTNQVETIRSFTSRPSTANARGWMVGSDMQGRGLLVAGGQQVQLPDGYLHRPGGLTNIPQTISDDGRIIGGQSDDPAGVIHAMRWRCI